MSGGSDIRPALGEPAEVAKTLTAEARPGADVVRLVAGDPLTVDAVITEVNAVARSHLHIEIVPGLAATSAVPDLCGAAAGLVAHRCRRARRRGLGGAGRGSRAADPAGHRVASGRRGPHPDRARAGRDHPVRGDRAGHHLPAAFGRNHAARVDRLGRAGRHRPGQSRAGPADRAAGGDHRQDGGQPGEAELVGEPRTVRLDRVGAPHQGPGRRDERAADLLRRAADRGADHRRRAAAQPRADGARRQGPGRRPLPVGGVHLHQRGARGVGEVRRVRSGRPRVLRA